MSFTMYLYINNSIPYLLISLDDTLLQSVNVSVSDGNWHMVSVNVTAFESSFAIDEYTDVSASPNYNLTSFSVNVTLGGSSLLK